MAKGGAIRRADRRTACPFINWGQHGLGTTVHEAPDDAANTSPIAFLAGNRTPFFVTWSENDSLICKAQGPAFAVALQAAGSPVENHMFDLLDHFWIHIDQQRPINVWTRTLKAWMTEGPGPRKAV